MRFKQIRKDIYIDFGAKMTPFYYYHFDLNKSNISRKTQSVVDNLHILCLFTFHCAS